MTSPDLLAAAVAEMERTLRLDPAERRMLDPLDVDFTVNQILDGLDGADPADAGVPEVLWVLIRAGQALRQAELAMRRAKRPPS